MKTLRQIISEIDFNNESLENDINWDNVTESLRIQDSIWVEQTRLRCFFYERWYCTDTWVGGRAYFLDEELVAVSYQIGRKWDEDIEYISKEAYDKVKSYVISLIEKEEPSFVPSILQDGELDKLVEDRYQVEFNSQILQKQGYYEDELVDIVRTNYDYGDPNYFHGVKIRLSSGKTKIVHVSELYFDYNT